jgi:uncharacterized delta-60 repeat protein
VSAWTLLVLVAPVAPAGALASAPSAPGRVLFPVDAGAVVEYPSGAAALAQGGAILVGHVQGILGMYVVKVTASGAPDPSFGVDGSASIAGAYAFLQVLTEPDGKVLIVAVRSRASEPGRLVWGEPHGQLVVFRLTANGELDESYGTDGAASVPLQAGCICSGVAAEQEDGELVLTGQLVTGKTELDNRWGVARLTSSGALDAGFGSAGVAVLAGEDGVGLEVAVDSDGSITTQGQIELESASSSGPALMLTRLTVAGAPDGSFADGDEVRAPVGSLDDSYGQRPTPVSMLVGQDGSVLIQAYPVPLNPAHPVAEQIGVGLARYTAAGKLDPSFGYRGYMELPGDETGDELVPAAAGSVLAIHMEIDERATSEAGNERVVPGVFEIERVDSHGALDTTLGGSHGLTVAVPFGGGESDILERSQYTLESPPSLEENSFLPASLERVPQLLAQPDGTYLIPGSVFVREPRPSAGRDALSADIAVAVLTPSFTLNPAVGEPEQPLQLAVGVVAQRAAGDVRADGVRVRLDASMQGLCSVSIVARGHVLARHLLPILRVGYQTLPVKLTAFGERYLRAHRDVPVEVRATARDLLARSTTARATGLLG